MTTTPVRVEPAAPAAARPPRPWQLLLGALVVGLAALGVTVWTGDGRPFPAPPGLPDPGVGVPWALTGVRLLGDLAGTLTVGLLLTGAVLAPARQGGLAGPALRWARAARWPGLVWALAALAQGVLTLLDVTGLPLGTVPDPALVGRFLLDLDQGRALLAQAVLALLAAAIATVLLTPRVAALGALVAVLAWLPPTLTGHSGAAEDHALAVSSLAVHVVFAALWAGGLAAVVLLGVADRKAAVVAVPRLSALALWCVVAVGASGLVNGALRLTSPTELVGTSYGRLLLVKTLALVVLAAFGWWHRRQVLGRLGEAARALLFLRVAAVEVLVMAATVGVAVGLSRTPPPVDDTLAPVDVTPARAVLGYELPPAPTPVGLLWGEARPEGFWITVCVLLVALYLTGVRTLSRRGDRWPVGRTAAWLAGTTLLLALTSSGVATYAAVLFSAHMVEHMVLSMVVPLLLVLGAPVTLALRSIPPRRGGGPREWLLAIVHSRLVRLVSHPIIATAIFVGSFYALYFTGLLAVLMGSHWGHVAMNAHFVLSGGLFFWVLVGVDPGPRRPPHVVRLVMLLLVIPLHAFFSVAVMSATGLLDGGYFASLQRPYSTDLVADQQLGGGIGWALGELPIVIVLVALFLQWLRSDEREARRLDREADRAARGEGGRDELADYNAYLASLGRRRP